MYLRLLAALCLAFWSVVSVAASPRVGDTYESVLAEKGRPEGKSGAGAVMILTYPDEVITLKAGKVTAVRSSEDVSTVPDRKITEADRQRVAAENAAAAAAVAREAAGQEAGWMTDYAAALAAARSQNRRVLLFFTGSDWCGWCIRLNREVLATPEFAAYAREKLVLAEFDFPKRKAQPEQVRARNEELARKFGIRGFPTLVVLSPQGKVVGRLGYVEGGAKAFLEKLDRL